MYEWDYIRQNENAETPYTNRSTNEQADRHYFLPTIRPKLQAGGNMRYIYRWGTTASPAYINNKQDMGNELSISEYLWYRAGGLR